MVFLAKTQYFTTLVKCDFETDNVEDDEKLTLLKDKIKKSGFEVMSDYPASFSRLDGNGVAVLTQLESFGTRLFDNLWNAILNIHAAEESNKGIIHK